MKKSLLCLVFLLSAAMLNAQEPLCAGNGPVIDDYNEFSDISIISNDGSGFTAYCSAIVPGKKNNHHAILTYDKAGNTLSAQKLILPVNTYRLVTIDLGDSCFVTYSCYPDKKHYEYATAVIPKGQKETAVSLTRRLALETDRSGYVKDFVARSPNGKYNAVLLICINKRSEADNARFFVYGEDGREVASKTFSFAVEGGCFDVADFKVSDEGEVIFLFRTGVEKANDLHAHKLQILACKDNEFTANYSIDFPDEVVNSAKMCLLKNGNVFIGGYTAAAADRRETGYFATAYKPAEKDFEPIHSYEFTEEERPGKKIMFGRLVPIFFHELCTDILELENGNVMMLGEHTTQIVVKTMNMNMVTTSYNHLTNHIGYETFKPDGTCLTDKDFQMLYRKACKNVPFSCSSSIEAVSPKYSAIGLSHAAFVKGNDVYVLFTDHEKNLLTHDDSAPVADLNMKRGKTCLLMARLNAEDAPEYRIVYSAGKEKKTMNKLWLFDGENVYFGSNNNKTYWLDHFRLPKE